MVVAILGLKIGKYAENSALSIHLLDLRRALWYKARPLCRKVEFYKKSGDKIMSRVCQVTGKRPVTGNNVSHAHNKTKRRFLPNLHTHRYWVESENRWVKLRLTTKGMRIIDKKGIDSVLGDMRARGVQF